MLTNSAPPLPQHILQAGKLVSGRFHDFLDVPIIHWKPCLVTERRWLVQAMHPPNTRSLHKGLPPRFQGVSTELVFSNCPPKWPTIPVTSLLLFSFTPYPSLLYASCSHPYLSLVYSQNKFYFPFLGRSMYPSHTPSPSYYLLCDVGWTAICCECHWLKKKLLLASGWTE